MMTTTTVLTSSPNLTNPRSRLEKRRRSTASFSRPNDRDSAFEEERKESTVPADPKEPKENRGRSTTTETRRRNSGESTDIWISAETQESLRIFGSVLMGRRWFLEGPSDEGLFFGCDV